MRMKMELKKWMKEGGCWKRKTEEDKAEEFKVWEKEKSKWQEESTSFQWKLKCVNNMN